MSVAEIKQAVESLTADQRLELVEYLRWRSAKDDPAWQGELGRRLDRCLAGGGHAQEELFSLHERLGQTNQ